MEEIFLDKEAAAEPVDNSSGGNVDASLFREVTNVEEAARDGYRVLKVICASREEAEELLGLVLYKCVIGYREEPSASEEMVKVSDRIAALDERRRKFQEERSVRSFVAKTIGCKKCGSTLAKDFLKDDFCPLCGNDLRSQSTLDGLAQMDASMKELEEELSSLRILNLVKNGKVVYLCKK